jgi:hypothetical protein
LRAVVEDDVSKSGAERFPSRFASDMPVFTQASITPPFSKSENVCHTTSPIPPFILLRNQSITRFNRYSSFAWSWLERFKMSQPCLGDFTMKDLGTNCPTDSIELHKIRNT